MPSALFEIDPGTGSYGSSGVAQNAAAAVTVNCRITSLVGVDSIEWRIFGTHGVTAPTITLSGAPNGQIASFTLGSAASNPNGQAYGIECKVNGGTSRFNPQGHTATNAVYVLSPLSQRPFFIGETFEADASYGVVPRLNSIFGGSGGLVSGPTTSTDNAIVRWNGTTGDIVQNSDATIADTGELTLPVSGTAASAGDIRTRSAFTLKHRNDANSADVDVITITTDQLFIGDSTDTAGIQFETKTGTGIVFRIAGSTEFTINSSEVAASDILKVGNDLGTVASAGDIRLRNNCFLRNRNAANNADIDTLRVDSSDNVILGGSGASSVRMTAPAGTRVLADNTGVAFNGQATIARPDYTVTNFTTDRSFDQDTVTTAELADVVATLITDLISYGLFQ